MIVSEQIDFIQGSVTSDTLSRTIKLHPKTKGVIVEVSGTGSFSVRIESSPNGTDWYSINELDAFSVDSMQSLSSSINLFRFLRAKIDVESGGLVSKVALHYSL